MELIWRKRNLLIFAAAMALLFAFIPMSVYAQSEATVNATVTPGFAAVSTDIGSVAYGVLTIGTTAAVPTPAFFTATNDGSIAADFLIRGDITADWALSGTAGANAYVHRASPDAFTTTFVLTTTNQTFETGIAASGTSVVSLNMDMPTSTSSTAEQTAPVTIVAVVP